MSFPRLRFPERALNALYVCRPRDATVLACLAALAAGTAAAAVPMAPPRPKTLQCASLAGDPAVSFTVAAFDTDAPRVAVAPEGTTLETDPFTTRLCAEGSYCAVFRTDELAELAAGKLATTTALMSSAADSENPRRASAVLPLACAESR